MAYEYSIPIDLKPKEYKLYEIDVARDGYIPMFVAGYTTGNVWCIMYASIFDSGKASVGIFNSSDENLAGKNVWAAVKIVYRRKF